MPKVYKIFGPGNQYVTAAKQLACNYGTAIDMPAGPSEVMVIGLHSSGSYLYLIVLLLPFFYLSFLLFCQKYLPLEHGFTSEEGHFLPLEEGVKHLPNPHILHFSVK